MKHGVLAAVLATAACIASVERALAHGGNYAGGSYGGPGDTVPPGSGGSTGGAGGPSTPGPGGPSTPGPSGPSTPGGAPGTGGPSTPGGGMGPGPGGGPSTGGDTPQDLTRWQVWWELNKDPYLDLRRRIYMHDPRTGSDDFFLGRAREMTRDYLRPRTERVRGVIVPALFDALEGESSNDVITGALLALAKIGDAPESDERWSYRDRFASFLTHANQEVAETAALALGILGNVEHKDLLASLLRDERSKLASFGVHFKGAVPERTRVFAAYGLGLLGQRADSYDSSELASILAAPLSSGGREFAKRDVPVACVLAFGLVALPPASGTTVPEAEPGEFFVREHQIAWLLERFADRSNTRALIRAQMPRSLARLAADLPPANPARAKVVEALVSAMEATKPEDDVYVRQSCVLALGQLGDCDADPLDARVRASLMRMHERCSDQQVKRFTLIALAQVCGRPGTGDALAGLRGKKDDPRAFLAERLKKGQGNERCWAALALAVLERGLDDKQLVSSPQSRTVLRWALEGANAGQDVGAYAIAIGLVGDRAAVPALLGKLEKINDPEARGYIALALGMLGDPRATEPVQAVVARSKYQPELLRSAATALALIGDGQAVPRLTEMLTAASALSSQAAIATALGTIGDSRSVDPLVGMLADRDRTATARGFAAAALGIVADQSPLTWVTHYSLDLNYRAVTETLNSADGGTGLLQLL